MSCAFVIDRIVPCALCACHPRTQCYARSEGSAHGRSYKSNFRYAKVTFQKKIYIRSGGWRLRKILHSTSFRSRMTAQGMLEENKQPAKLKFNGIFGGAETLLGSFREGAPDESRVRESACNKGAS